MKKILLLLGILLTIFVVLVYLSVSGTKEEFHTAVIQNFENLENLDFREHDSVMVAATTLYEGNKLKETMQGGNYRKAWATPVKVPVVFLDTLYGGMKILKEGGGSQTHSLRLASASGVVYTLRSINKDPGSHVPQFAKNLGLENIIIDGISAQHPYGAIAAAALAEKAGLLHTNPRPVFIPKQDLLEEYNDKYGNRLFLLEYETEGEVNWTGHENIIRLVDTEDLQERKMQEGEKLQIDRNLLVRSRLFDLLIGDWDRHAKQWGWLIQRTSTGLTAIPLPGDRDNAFFKPEGVIPSIISNKNVEPLVRPFEKEIDYLPGLVYPFDIYFLKGTSEEIFLKEAKYLQQALTDDNINDALRQWPPQIYQLDGEEIAEKIKKRREDLLTYALAFRRIIEEKDYLSEPLKGSENLDLPENLLKCFECNNN